jgi:hypothetical protein
VAINYEGGASDVATATSDTSIVVTSPAGTGGRLYAIGNCADARTISAPAGWTQEQNDTSGTYRTYLWSRDDDAAGSYTFTASGTFNNAAVSVHRVSGASSNAAAAGFATGGNSQTQTAPTITTPSANCLVFWGVFIAGTGTATADKGTERADITNATASAHHAVYTNLEATAGSITGAVITTTEFGAKRVFSFAVESSGGGASGGPFPFFLDSDLCGGLLALSL